ncbi:sugar phosphate nucleotidyltransferase [Streptomyces sp. NPDC001373]|uniref:sugar phosphate nucleotidyltransferase n=1 Tax=Streptomyces sp. NPDC001373 TaxID=3364565 RepID=UPI0036B6709C
MCEGRHRRRRNGHPLLPHLQDEDTGLRDFFTARGQADKYAPIAHLHAQSDFVFIEQPRDSRYGTALPVMLAADFINGDDFLLLAGDDLLLRADGGHDLADLTAARTAAGTPGAIAAATVPGDAAHRYGILTPRTMTTGHQVLDSIAEKPTNYAQSTAYINISRTLLSGEAVSYFEKLQPSTGNGEYQATDAIAAYARDHDVLIHPVAGAYHDCGNTAGWLAANTAAARAHGISVA